MRKYNKLIVVDYSKFDVKQQQSTTFFANTAITNFFDYEYINPKEVEE
jgi:hypothetical protein